MANKPTTTTTEPTPQAGADIQTAIKAAIEPMFSFAEPDFSMPETYYKNANRDGSRSVGIVRVKTTLRMGAVNLLTLNSAIYANESADGSRNVRIALPAAKSVGLGELTKGAFVAAVNDAYDKWALAERAEQAGWAELDGKATKAAALNQTRAPRLVAKSEPKPAATTPTT